MLSYYAEKHAARQANIEAAYPANTDIPLDEFVIGMIKTKRREGLGQDAREQYEILARPTAAQIFTLEEERMGAPEPHEEWEHLELEDDRPVEIKPSYALVVSIQ